MIPCVDTEHHVVWVEIADVFECSRCLTLIRVAPNVCGKCLAPVDDHKHYLADFPICPPKK